MEVKTTKRLLPRLSLSGSCSTLLVSLVVVATRRVVVGRAMIHSFVIVLRRLLLNNSRSTGRLSVSPNLASHDEEVFNRHRVLGNVNGRVD